MSMLPRLDRACRLASLKSVNVAQDNSTADRQLFRGWGPSGAGAEAIGIRPNTLYYLGFGAPFNAARALAEDVAFAGRNGLAAAVFDVSSFSLPGLSERSQRRL